MRSVAYVARTKYGQLVAASARHGKYQLAISLRGQQAALAVVRVVLAPNAVIMKASYYISGWLGRDEAVMPSSAMAAFNGAR